MRLLLTASLVGLIWSLASSSSALGHGKVVCNNPGDVGTGLFDPIVFPEVPQGSHSHTFMGNERITQSDYRSDSTYNGPTGLVNGPTTCDHPDDTAAYWVPTIERENGERLHVVRLNAYYYPGSRGGKRHLRTTPVHPYPRDLRLVAGRRDGTGTDHIFFDCGDNSGSPDRHSTPGGAHCSTAGGDGVGLRLKVWFPDCWDGSLTPRTGAAGVSTADFSDAAPPSSNHLVYSDYQTAACPAGYQKLPSLQMNVRFDYDGPGFTLESDVPWGSFHADFWNTWVQDAQHNGHDRGGLVRFVNRCIDDVPEDTGGGLHHGSDFFCGEDNANDD